MSPQEGSYFGFVYCVITLAICSRLKIIININGTLLIISVDFSADIMTSLCDMGVHIHVHISLLSNFQRHALAFKRYLIY